MINKDKTDQISYCNYTDLPEDWENNKISECCESKVSTEVPGGDCCYDTWQDKLNKVKTEVNEVTEAAKLCKDQLEIVAMRRDKLKIWVDELTKIDEFADSICDQLELLENQTESISNNTGKAVKAIKILFCMIRDFYSQLDFIHSQYDELMNCIKCLNHPLLVEGQGLVKCLEEYFAKLEAVEKTKASIIQSILKAIHLASKIDENLEKKFGLRQIISCWQKVFDCDEGCDDENSVQRSKQQTKSEQKEACLDLNADWDPMITLPICNDAYYLCIKERYEADVKNAKDTSKDLKEKNKKKEKLLACKESLEAAIQEVDPKARC